MKYHKTILPNGLRIIVVPTHGNPSITTMVIVETGSNYETKEQNGLSHFLEHMCFKGTINRPTALDIALELDGMGAYNNAFTSSELTGYFAKAEKRHFKKVLDILSDMYLTPIFPKDDIEKERGVIIEEIEMYEDQPQYKVWDVLSKLLYGDTPAGRPVMGPKENIKKFTHKDLAAYRKKHYIAEKTIILVSGDITPRLAVTEAKKAFKKIPSGNVVSKLPVKPSQKKPGLLIEKKKTNQTHLVFGIRAYDAQDKRLPALTVLSYVLGGGMSGRLWQKVRHTMGACYYIDASSHEHTDHGLFSISTGINAARAVEVEKAILDECKRLVEVPVPEAELEKAKENYVGHLFLGLETSNRLAEFYGVEEVVSKKLKSPLEIEKLIRAVTTRDVMDVAKDLFRDEKLNLAIVGNISDQKKIKEALTFK